MLAVEFHDALFNGFSSAARGSIKQKPKYINFDREDKHGVAVFTDDSLSEVASSTADIKIAWLVESPDYKKDIYKRMARKKFYRNFDRVYTFDCSLLAKDSRFRFLPFGGSWIEDRDWMIYPKDKMVSIISSHKRQLPGHRLRHEIIKKYDTMIDGVYGSGYRAFDEKVTVMKRYRFSIVIENCRKDYYFTEKLLDCFATGTVPIYWGCPSIADFFNSEGIISFSSLRQLQYILKNLTAEDYTRRLEAVGDNLRKMKTYVMPEDYMFTKLIGDDPLFTSKLLAGQSN